MENEATPPQPGPESTLVNTRENLRTNGTHPRAGHKHQVPRKSALRWVHSPQHLTRGGSKRGKAWGT